MEDIQYFLEDFIIFHWDIFFPLPLFYIRLRSFYNLLFIEPPVVSLAISLSTEATGKRTSCNSGDSYFKPSLILPSPVKYV